MDTETYTQKYIRWFPLDKVVNGENIENLSADDTVSEEQWMGRRFMTKNYRNKPKQKLELLAQKSLPSGYFWAQISFQMTAEDQQK